MFLGLRRKAIKSQDKGLTPFTQATGAHLNSGGCPALGSLSCGSQKPGQISRHIEPSCSRWEFSQKREKRMTWGSQASVPDPQLYFQKQLIYPKLYIKKQTAAGAAVLTLIETRLSFCIPSRIQKVSGGLHYLLAKRLVNIFMALFLDNCLSTRKLLFPRSVFP